MKKYIIGLMVFVLLFVVGCTTQPDTTMISDNIISEPSEVDLVVTSIEFNGILYPIKNDKVPSPAGVNINLRETDYNEGELYTLISKKPTVGILSNINVGKAALAGEHYKILSPYYREIVGPGDDTMGKLVTRKDSNIDRPSQLEGKVVGIQGSADGSTIAMMTALRKIYNVDLDTITFQVVDSNMAPILVEEGKLDAAMFDSDYILTDDFSQRYKTVIDFNKEIYLFYGTVPPASFFVVKKEFYDASPQTYDLIVDYLTESYAWYKDNAEEVSRLEAEDSGNPYELLLLKSQYEHRGGYVTERDIAAYNDFYETAVMRGVISDVPNLNNIFIKK
jgi:hypothetical protein